MLFVSGISSLGSPKPLRHTVPNTMAAVTPCDRLVRPISPSIKPRRRLIPLVSDVRSTKKKNAQCSTTQEQSVTKQDTALRVDCLASHITRHVPSLRSPPPSSLLEWGRSGVAGDADPANPGRVGEELFRFLAFPTSRGSRPGFWHFQRAGIQVQIGVASYDARPASEPEMHSQVGISLSRVFMCTFISVVTAASAAATLATLAAC